jgi:hypothetical protein
MDTCEWLHTEKVRIGLTGILVPDSCFQKEMTAGPARVRYLVRELFCGTPGLTPAAVNRTSIE